jgi:hypothetical protein
MVMNRKVKSASIPWSKLRMALERAKSRRGGAQGGWYRVPEKVRFYTLKVFLIGGNYTEAFARKNRVVSRTILIRGDQTLEDLHYAVFKAYNRWEQHMYEFQFGKRPMDPAGPRYVLPNDFEIELSEGKPAAGRVDLTTIESLGLKVGSRFGYWFDFGDDWWHQINVEEIKDTAPKGRYPRIIKREGKSPPQYPPEDEE